MEEAQVFGVDWIRALQVIPNEYLYYYYFNRDAVRRILESPQTRGDFLLETQGRFFGEAAAQPEHAAKLWTAAVDERGASYMAEAKGGVQGAPAIERDRETDPAHLGYAGVALGVMAAISRNERRTMILNVRNRGTIQGLPADAVVEVSTMVDANGVHPLTLETQPDLHQLGLMQQVKAVERLTISAAMTGSSTDALKAFALHPLVDSVSVARELLSRYVDSNPDIGRVLAKRSKAA